MCEFHRFNQPIRDHRRAQARTEAQEQHPIRRVSTECLQHFASHDGDGKVAVVGDMFKPEYYGIALPNDSVLRKPINLTLSDLIANGTLTAIQQKWFGNGP